jgi:phenylacetate-CoA ligase
MYQSKNSDLYHNDLTYSFTEFDENNTIVGTSFLNYVMPFIRYKTNDVASLNENVTYDTSRPYVVSKIDGRVDDMVVSESGSKIPSVNFYTVMSKIEEITMFQLHQRKDKSLHFNIVISPNFNDSIFNTLKTEIAKRVGDLPLTIQVVPEIKRDLATGKIRCVISEIQ